MFPIRFPALLKTDKDEILEEGIAYISKEDASVEFTNEFVPLMKLGATAKIIRIEKDYETHCFEGSVYLSSRNLLRITSVNDYVLEDAKNICTVNTAIDTLLTPYDQGIATPAAIMNEKVGASIQSVSMQEVLFTSSETLNVGNRFLLSINEPLSLRRVVIEIYRCIFFGNGSFTYQCNILSISDACQATLKDFVDANLKHQQKVFK